MHRFDTPVLENRELCRDYHRLSYAWPGDAGLPAPWRFLTVRASATSDPLLRRPFAYSGYDPGSGSASFIYQVRGPAMRRLTATGPGAFLDVLSPLGRGFPDPSPGSRPVLLGGGIGLGPLLYAAEDLGRREVECAGSDPGFPNRGAGSGYRVSRGYGDLHVRRVPGNRGRLGICDRLRGKVRPGHDPRLLRLRAGAHDGRIGPTGRL